MTCLLIPEQVTTFTSEWVEVAVSSDLDWTMDILTEAFNT
jgi:hypothetical protein